MVSKFHSINIQLFAAPADEEDENNNLDLDSEDEDDDLENDEPSFDLNHDADEDENEDDEDVDDGIVIKKDDTDDTEDTEEEDNEEEIGLVDEEENTEDGEDEEEEETSKDETPAPVDNPAPKSTELELQIMTFAKKLGIKADNPQDAIDSMIAESENLTLEEYRKNQKEEREVADAKALLKQQEFAKVMAADLADLKKAIPSLAEVSDLRKIDNFAEFGKLRDKGLTPVQAYMAVNGDKLLNGKQAIAKQKAVNDSKAHLRSVTPKNTSDTLPRIPKDEYAMWRDLFPEYSEKELRQVYNKSNN